MSQEKMPNIDVKITGFCKCCGKYTVLITAALCEKCNKTILKRQLKQFKKDYYKAFSEEYKTH